MMFKKKSSKSDLETEYQCTIRFLDDSEPIQISFKKDSTGQWLLDQVCQRLNLIEKDYFGLRYVDMERQRHWLDPVKTVYKQLKELIVSTKKNDKTAIDPSVNPMVLCFRVKFYPADPMSLHEEITRYFLFLQLRRDLHHGRLLCPPSDANLLAAYIIQSELGDYDIQDHPPGYVAQFKMLPKQTPKIEEQITEIHKTLAKQVPSESENNFLKKAATLDTYGVDPHQVKDQKGNQLYLGITHQGIMTFHGNRRTHLFVWTQIKRIVYEGKMFIVHVNTNEDEEIQKKKQQPIGYKCPTTSACKYLWRCAVEQQFFFTLASSMNAPKVRSGGSLLTRGSKFRFSGRCQTEAIAASGGISRPGPSFTRSSSLPNFSHKKDSSKISMRNTTMPRDLAIKEAKARFNELPVDVPGQTKIEAENLIVADKEIENVTTEKAPIASSESSDELSASRAAAAQGVTAVPPPTTEEEKEELESPGSAAQNALQVPENADSVSPVSETSDVIFVENLKNELASEKKQTLDEQIKELEQHWVRSQTNNIHHPSTPSGDSDSVKSDDENAATESDTAATPSLMDRLIQIKPNMTYASAVVALLIAAIVLLLLISRIQHPVVASIRRGLFLEPVSDYISDKVGSLFRS